MEPGSNNQVLDPSAIKDIEQSITTMQAQDKAGDKKNQVNTIDKLPGGIMDGDKLYEVFSKMFQSMNDRIDKLALTVEYNQRKESLKQTTKPSGVIYKGQRPEPTDQLSIAAKPYVTDQGYEYKWGSSHEWRKQTDKHLGWEACKNEKGEEIRIGDAPLLKMGKDKYENAIAAPRRQRACLNKEADPAQDFKNQYSDVGRAWNGKPVVEGPGLSVDSVENIN